jgi:hypothetical protein
MLTWLLHDAKGLTAAVIRQAQHQQHAQTQTSRQSIRLVDNSPYASDAKRFASCQLQLPVAWKLVNTSHVPPSKPAATV